MADFDNLAELDRHKVFDTLDAQPDQLRQNYCDEMADDITSAQGVGIQNIILAGMGGSALVGNILKNWLYDKLKVPLEVVRGYDIPGYVNERSLVIISSYSGNTEETLSALKQAQRLNGVIFIMAAGGKLVDIADSENYSLLKLPHASQPRFAVLAGLKALACLLEDLELTEGVDLRRELIDVANFLDEEKSALSLDTKHDNLAREIALELVGKPVLVYGGPALGSAAYKWKININETSKQLAFYNVYSELNHNEFQGWLFPKDKDLAVVQLESELDTNRIKKRMIITEQLLAKHGFQPIKVKAHGRTHLEQLLYTILLGDYVSAYLGILNGIDPTPVDLIEELKKELS